ncbi:rubrerythrin [Methanocella sp. MCL-LM]|uniref:rubrerythrin n=1 Tax=Methanocella sp. MCL-LM TaxID=3412035 RepID=UPI003C70C3CE
MKKTIENLTKAFVGESQARNRYTFYASTARKEGYEQIAAIFTLTADNENEHAEWFFKMLRQVAGQTGEKLDNLAVETDVPAVWSNRTLDNLKAAAAGEKLENTKLYPEFARVAEMEGYPDIARRIRSIAVAEKHHEDRYGKLIKEIEAGTLFQKKEPVYWVCRKCGFLHHGMAPPEKCPSCDHERSYYERQSETY